MKLFHSLNRLLVAIIFLNILDGIFTVMHIERWGLDVERNPFMNGFISQYGATPFILLKMIIPVIVCLYVYVRYDEHASYAKRTRQFIGMVFLFYSGVLLLHVFNFTLYFFI